MRLLSIFALLFLLSMLLHTREQEQREQANAGEVAAVTQEAAEAGAAPPPPMQEDFSALIFKPPYPVGHFDFVREYSFGSLEAELKNLIVAENRYTITNHFCVVGYQIPRAPNNKRAPALRKEVVVYWREDKILYRWNGGDPKAAERDFYSARTILFNSRGISLDTAAPDDEGLSAKSETASFRENAENVVADCERHGKQYAIAPFAPPPRGFTAPPPPTAPRPAANPPAADRAPATAPAPAPRRAAAPDTPPAARTPASRTQEPTIRAWTPPPPEAAPSTPTPAPAPAHSSEPDPLSTLLTPDPKPAAPPPAPAAP
ncbi:MAG: hypothetical protein LBI92_11420 [Azoarcus sp.]|jgi:hypothetical protein|nr:hypothetical protein [Azoarcus sp.]